MLLVGSGSAARRHAANLRAVLPGCQLLLLHRRPQEEVDASLRQLVDESTRELATALRWEPDAAIVANAAPDHVAAGVALAGVGAHLLIEKPLASDLHGVDELLAVCRRECRVLLVGYCLRFHRPLQRLRDEVLSGAIGRPLSLQAEAGGFLPSWRPGTDYRSTVTARSALGGGAVLELSHEIDYATWIMGPVGSVGAATGKLSDLEIDVEDTAEIVLRFRRGGLGAIHLDLVQPVMTRSCKVIGSDGALVWNGTDDTVHRCSRGEEAWRVLVPAAAGDRNEMFLEEMRHFLACIDGSESPRVGGDEARHVLEVCMATKRSALEGTFVGIDQGTSEPRPTPVRS